MRQVKYLLFLIFSISLFTGCRKEVNFGSLGNFNQKVLLQYEFINYAWGFQNSGWFADSTGTVYTYNRPSDWNHCEINETLTEEEMESNLSKCIRPGIYYPQKRFLSAYNLFKSAKNGKILGPTQEMFDAGAKVYSCFIYNPTSRTYKKVLLRETGDFRIENSSSAAKEIVELMELITEELVKQQKI
ncbi:MAG: hypothetical protein Q8R90_05575 [Bacteroidales bacterium]|jgi:hypothetical protein|nr:hypothetical protein [Bacteroidales bacterium]